MKPRHLEKIRTIIKEATHLDISYAYDDLVFPEHSAFLLQFDDANPNNYFCYFREDCNITDKEWLISQLTEACNVHESTLIPKGAFKFEQQGEEVNIHFM